MLNLEVDLKDVDANSFDLLEDSVYRFKVTGAKVKKGVNSNYIEWENTCQDPKHPKAKVMERTSGAANAVWRTKKFLMALGDKEPTGLQVDETKYIGREFMGEVVTEVYEYEKDGQKKKGQSNKFSDYYPVPGAAPIATATQAAPAQVAKPAQVAEEVPF